MGGSPLCAAGRRCRASDNRDKRRTLNTAASRSTDRPQKEISRRDILGQRRRDARTRDAAEGRAGGDKSEQTFALFGVEDIDHQGPEHGHHKEIEDGCPDEEEPTDPDVLLGGRHVEKQDKNQQIGDEESIRNRDEADARQLGHQRRKRRIDQDHSDESAGEKPLEVFNTPGDSHLIADGTQNIIGRKYGEDVEPGPTERAHLRRAHVNETFQQPINRPVFHLLRGFRIAHEFS